MSTFDSRPFVRTSGSTAVEPVGVLLNYTTSPRNTIAAFEANATVQPLPDSSTEIPQPTLGSSETQDRIPRV